MMIKFSAETWVVMYIIIVVTIQDTRAVQKQCVTAKYHFCLYTLYYIVESNSKICSDSK